MSEQAVQSLEAALKERCDHYRRMDHRALLEAAVRIVKESAVEYDRAEIVPVVLTKVAALGSIDAVAIMVMMNCSQAQVAAAICAIVERSEDVKEGMLVAGLAAAFEEWAEEEIAAGRMIKTVCPRSGKFLYSTVDRGAGESQ